MIMSCVLAASLVAGMTRGMTLLQAVDTAPSGDLHLLTIFVGIAAFSLLVLVLLVVGAAIAGLVAARKISAEVKLVRSQVMARATPLIDKGQGLVEKAQTLMVDLTPEIKKITTQVYGITEKTQGLIADLTPEIKGITSKVHQITGYAEEIAGVAKDKAHEFAPTISAMNGTVQEANETVRMANQKTREQLQRVDVLVTQALDSTVTMGHSISDAVTKPVRDVAAMVDNAKEAVGSMFSSAKSSVESAVKGTKNSVDTMSSGTKSFVDSLLNGAKGISASFLKSRQKPVSYKRASYVSDPAPVNPPTRQSERGEVDNFSTL